jgi:hypothetical protein
VAGPAQEASITAPATLIADAIKLHVARMLHLLFVFDANEMSPPIFHPEGLCS